METLIIQVDCRPYARNGPPQLGITVESPISQQRSLIQQKKQPVPSAKESYQNHDYQNLDNCNFSLTNSNGGNTKLTGTIKSNKSGHSSLRSSNNKQHPTGIFNNSQTVHEGLQVTQIQPGSVIDRNGQFRVGDIIVECNGVNLQRPFAEAQKTLKQFVVEHTSHAPLVMKVLRKAASSSSSLPSTTGSQITVIEKDNNYSRETLQKSPTISETKPNNILQQVTPSTSASPLSSRSPLSPTKAPLHLVDELNTRKLGVRHTIRLKKCPQGGFGIKIAERDNMHGTRNRPIYITAITESGSAYRDGRLQQGDMLLKVNGYDLLGRSQPEVTKMLKAIGPDQEVEFVVSRQEIVNRVTEDINKDSIENACDTMWEKTNGQARSRRSFCFPFLSRPGTHSTRARGESTRSTDLLTGPRSADPFPRTFAPTSVSTSALVALQTEQVEQKSASTSSYTPDCKSLIDLDAPEHDDSVFESSNQFEKKIDSLLNVPTQDGPGIYIYDIPLNDTKSAGLGLYLKYPRRADEHKDLGIWIEKVITGGAAWKDGKLQPDDQILSINGIDLIGLSNAEASETLIAAVCRGIGPEATPNTIRLKIQRRDPLVVAKILQGTNNRIECSDTVSEERFQRNGYGRKSMSAKRSIYGMHDRSSSTQDSSEQQTRATSMTLPRPQISQQRAPLVSQAPILSQAPFISQTPLISQARQATKPKECLYVQPPIATNSNGTQQQIAHHFHQSSQLSSNGHQSHSPSMTMQRPHFYQQQAPPLPQLRQTLNPNGCSYMQPPMGTNTYGLMQYSAHHLQHNGSQMAPNGHQPHATYMTMQRPLMYQHQIPPQQQMRTLNPNGCLYVQPPVRLTNYGMALQHSTQLFHHNNQLTPSHHQVPFNSIQTQQLHNQHQQTQKIYYYDL